MPNKKYELCEDDYMVYKGKKLYRIKCISDDCDMIDVFKGDLGGYVEGCHNLSEFDSCWIYDDAMVYGNAYISRDTIVGGNAEIYSDDKSFLGGVHISGGIEIKDNVKICGSVKIYGDNIFITDNVKISDNVLISGNDITISGKSKIYENAKISDITKISGRSKIYGDSYIVNNAVIDNAEIRSTSHYSVFTLNLPGGIHFLTWTFSNDVWNIRTIRGNSSETSLHLNRKEVSKNLSILNRELFLKHYCKIVDEIKENTDWKGNYSVKH